MAKSSKYKGVCRDRIHEKWVARIVINGKAISIGYFDDEEAASRAWIDYRDKHRPRQTVLDLDGEEWRVASRLGGTYYVSNKGRVKNTDFKRQGDEILLRLAEDAHGYYEVKRGSIHGKVHRLVLEAFVGKSHLSVNHKDSNPKNNCLENLEYVTQRENISHALLRDRGFVGCCWDKSYGKWTSHIDVNGHCIYLGRFDRKEDAVSAYLNAMDRWGISNIYVNEWRKKAV